MKNSRMKITAVLFAMALTLSGCGDAMYEMTAEEQSMVVNYAAQSVAKFNTYQRDGEVFVWPDVLEGEDSSKAETEPAQKEEEQPGEELPGEETDTQQPLEEANLGQLPEAPSPEPENTGVTMNQALDLGVISADYAGHELTKSYMAEDYYVVDAEAGKQFLVVKYNLVNTSSQPLHIDILAMTPSFTAVINGDQTVPAQTSILLNDLSTYQSDIEAGGTNETVLLFQVPEDITDVTGIQLNVTMNGSQYTINL